MVLPSASILIVNFNSGHHLKTCLVSLQQQTREDFEVIVLDNASEDDSIEYAQKAVANDSRFRFILESWNFGFAEGNNRAAGSAQADCLITLNPDAFPEPDWLKILLAATQRYPDVAMFGSTQIDATQPDKIDGAGDRYFAIGIPWRDQSRTRLDAAKKRGRNTYETFSPCAAAALYRTNLFRDAGGFDETFFCYVEDVDIAFRLRRRGHRCLQVIDAVVHHVGGGASGGRRSDFARYHGTRNLIWCFWKNMPLALLVLLMPFHFLAISLLILVAALQGNGRAVAQGINDAIRGLAQIRRVRPAFGSSLAVSAFDWTPFGYMLQRLRSA